MQSHLQPRLRTVQRNAECVKSEYSYVCCRVRVVTCVRTCACVRAFVRERGEAVEMGIAVNVAPVRSRLCLPRGPARRQKQDLVEERSNACLVLLSRSAN
eukprot:36957-Pleurochrysis_carterae.AAC.2